MALDSAKATTNDTAAKKPAQFSDFFALFGLPVQFAINRETLDAQYRALQKKYHPDNQSQQHDDIDTQVAQPAANASGASAVINHAYQTLKMPDSRATYLLEMQDKAETLDNSIADLDFLDDAMTLRIDLDDAIQEQSLPQLQQIKPLVAARLEQQSNRFEKAYNEQNWSEACDAAQKLKFLVKLNIDVLAGIDTIANQADAGDDDLYV
jgi:molecular chaperone HscB